jgi:hypothetical protein
MLHPTELMVLSAQSKVAKQKRLTESQSEAVASEATESEATSVPIKTAAMR